MTDLRARSRVLLEDSLAAGATLEIEVEPVEVTCRACGRAVRSETMVYDCPACASPDVTVRGGADLLLLSMSMDCADQAADRQAADEQKGNR